MAIKNIILAGTPLLRQIAPNVDPSWFNTTVAEQLVDDLIATMKAREGVGLAAPQIGVSLRLFAYGFEINSRYPDQNPVPLNIFFNPEIIKASDDMIYLYEGCLSVPQIRGLVPRHAWLEIRAQDIHGNWFEKRLENFEARIFQHELDHLNGKIFPERMDNLRTLGVTSALREAGLIR
jgi:peptide deformylase